MNIYGEEGGVNIYVVQEKDTKEVFILKIICIVPTCDDSFDKNSTDAAVSKRKKEMIEKKQKLEELILVWKTVIEKSENVVKYIDHWYGDDDEYLFIVTEYCTGGDLAQEIEKRIKEKRKFSEEVNNYYNYL
jgi:serine/threonine protein kinase